MEKIHKLFAYHKVALAECNKVVRRIQDMGEKMNTKEEKIFALLKEKKKLFTIDELSEATGEGCDKTFLRLEDLCKKGKVVQLLYDEGLFYATTETMLAFEKKRREVEAEFGID